MLLVADVAAFGFVAFAVVRKHRAAAVAAAAAAGPPPVAALFMDCDDCLYQNNWATARKITDSIAAYTAKLGVSKEKAYSLYQTYGTCIKGLLTEGTLDEAGAEDFLREVHLISYDDIKPDPALRSVLAAIAVSNMWVFTASTSEHARRCLDRIGLADLPWKGVIDCRSCQLETCVARRLGAPNRRVPRTRGPRPTPHLMARPAPRLTPRSGARGSRHRKHSRSSFLAAMKIAGVSEPSECIFCDDSVKNIRAAKEVGWRTVLVGKVDRDTGQPVVCDAADWHIASLHELRVAVPELFTPWA